MNKHIKIVIICLFTCLPFYSCYDFLEETPKGFLTSSHYYENKTQVEAAVNGLYDGLDNYFVNAFGVAVSPAWALEYLPGFCTRPNTGGDKDFQFLRLSGIDAQNEYISTFWSDAGYFPIENCNNFIEKVTELSFLSDDEKKNFLGQAYYLRAHYYYLLVRLYGDIPLKLTPTTNLENIQIPKSPVKEVYDQIVSDLQEAEKCDLSWADPTGRVNAGAVKYLLAEVYMTMAGYPLRAGEEYYQKAYEKTKEIIGSNQFSLYSKYSDLRRASNENYDEHIFMFQKMQEKNENIIHFSFLPANQRISILNGNVGGALKPVPGFVNSYPAGDKRTEEQAYYYTSYPRKNGSGDQTFEPYLFKYWDADAEISGRSGANIWYIRYADVLLLCAEAKTMADGSSTTDATAIDAWYSVRKRALPAEAKPASISFEQVYKERNYELCFESKTWFDILRTRKIYNYANNSVVDIIGYLSPQHTRAFEEKDLLFPYPYAETVSNPLLLEEIK